MNFDLRLRDYGKIKYMPDGATTEAPVSVEPVESVEPVDYTPHPEFEKPTTSESPKYQEPTNDPKIDRLMADIMSQAGMKSPQEATKAVEQNLPQKERKKGIWDWTDEDINNFIKNLWERIKAFFKNPFK